MINMTMLNIFYYDAEKYSLDEVRAFHKVIMEHLTPEVAAHTIFLPNDWKFEQYSLDKGKELYENY